MNTTTAIAAQLAQLTDTTEAAALVATLTGRQITQVAQITAAAVPASGTVAARRQALIQPVAMRARTQAITNGCRRGSYNPQVSVFTG